MEIEPIGYIRTPFGEKFGIPRQGALARARGVVEFKEEFSRLEAFKGIEEYDYLWLIWGFSGNTEAKKHIQVRPPVLEGEYRGVFATRSSFRPNNLGLTCVKFQKLERDGKGSVKLCFEGADMLDNTPLYDIKPYIAYAEAYPEARSGFGGEFKDKKLKVSIGCSIPEDFPEDRMEEMKSCLELDIRAGYQRKQDTPFGFLFDGFNISFRVSEDTIEVFDISKRGGGSAKSQLRER